MLYIALQRHWETGVQRDALIISSLRQPKIVCKRRIDINPSRAHPFPNLETAFMLAASPRQKKVKQAANTEPNLCEVSPLLLPVCLWDWLWHIGYHTDSLTPWISPTNSRNWLYHIDLTNATELTPSTDSTKYWLRRIGCASLFYSFAFCWFLFFFSISFISV